MWDFDSKNFINLVVQYESENSVSIVFWTVGVDSFEKFALTFTWSLLLLTAPGFFFFFTGQGEVSEEEWPLDEWEGLGILRFGATRSDDPVSEATDKKQRFHKPGILKASKQKQY